MTICLLILFGVINVVHHFYLLFCVLFCLFFCIILQEAFRLVIDVWTFTAYQIKGVLISWVLPALDSAYHHISWLCSKRVGNLL